MKNDLTTFEGQELSKSDRPELTSADTVISGGQFYLIFILTLLHMS